MKPYNLTKQDRLLLALESTSDETLPIFQGRNPRWGCLMIRDANWLIDKGWAFKLTAGDMTRGSLVKLTSEGRIAVRALKERLEDGCLRSIFSEA